MRTFSLPFSEFVLILHPVSQSLLANHASKK